MFVMKAWSLAWVSVYDACNWFLSCGSTPYVAPLTNEEIVWTQEMENKRLEALKPKEVVKPTPKVEKQQEKPKETKQDITECKTPDCYRKHPDYTYDPALEKTAILTDKVQVVACLNQNNMTIHSPKSWVSEDKKCFLWNGGRWKNIMLPPKSHIEHFKKIFWDEYKYRLAIVNFESSFNEKANNPHAKWYVQTLRSHNVKKDIVSQLSWLKNREEKNTWVACEIYTKENYTLFGTMDIAKGKLAKYTCMARRHYWAFSPWDGKHWYHSVMYAKRYKATTEYYLSLNF